MPNNHHKVYDHGVRVAPASILQPLNGTPYELEVR